MSKVRPVWIRETMSMERYQIDLARFLDVDLPRYQFAPSREIIAVLERLADVEAERETLRGIISHQDAQIVESCPAAKGVAPT